MRCKHEKHHYSRWNPRKCRNSDEKHGYSSVSGQNISVTHAVRMKTPLQPTAVVTPIKCFSPATDIKYAHKRNLMENRMYMKLAKTEVSLLLVAATK